MNHSELLERFFREVGAAREAEMYLRLFRKSEPNRFAVIEVHTDISAYSLHALALHLAFLAHLELYPVIVHGPGLSLGERDADRGLEAGSFWGEFSRSERVRGQAPGAQAVRDMTLALNEGLASAAILHDADTEGLVGDVFQSVGPRELKLRTAPITRAIGRGKIPVVAALATEPASRGVVPVPLQVATEALVAQLKPRKYIRICETGGLVRRDGGIENYVNLRLDGARLFASETLQPESAAQLRCVRGFLERLSLRATVQITSATNLLRELFTQKGGGTLIKLGRDLQVHRDLKRLSRDRLRGLIERAFDRKLARDFFAGSFNDRHPIKSVIIDPDYKGVAIVRQVAGLCYLDKFAVRPEARGEGIAHDLWTVLLRRHPRLFWRSRRENPINAWYYERASGMLRQDHWVVWWAGLPLPQVRKAIKLATTIAPTLAAKE